MKVKGVSFSSYKVNLNIYIYEKLDLFAFLFTQILFDNNLNKESKIVDCLLNLDIKEDLFYLFNNIYYKMIDNKIIEEVSEDIYSLKIKDVKVEERFVSIFKSGYFPVLSDNLDKEFIYDVIKNKLVVSDTLNNESNVCVITLDNSKNTIEELINTYRRSLLNMSDGECLINRVIVNPYYFNFELEKINDKYYFKGENKEKIYKDLTYNSLFISDEVIDGELLTNNIYFQCLYGNEIMKDYCEYVFIYNENKEFEVKDNVIYVGYKMDVESFGDLVNKDNYRCGVYLLENGEYISTFTKSKMKEIKDFKLYLIKNKDKFKENISKVIELI